MEVQAAQIHGMMDDFDAILNLKALVQVRAEEQAAGFGDGSTPLGERLREPVPEGAEILSPQFAPAVEAPWALAMLHTDVAAEEQIGDPETLAAEEVDDFAAGPIAFLPEDADAAFFQAALPEFTNHFEDADDDYDSEPAPDLAAAQAATPECAFTWPLGPGVRATVAFQGAEVSRAHIEALAQYLEVFRESLPG